VVISDTDVPGVRVAGLPLHAGLLPAKVLLEWRTCACAGDPPNPGMLHDVFAEISCNAVASLLKDNVDAIFDEGDYSDDWLRQPETKLQNFEAARGTSEISLCLRAAQ